MGGGGRRGRGGPAPPPGSPPAPYEIQTVAGTGTGGYSGDGGPATSARLNNPYGVVVDADGNLFVADVSNHRVRRIDPGGQISTVAGTGTQGYSGDGGPATSAMLSYPYGVAVDADGNLFIADTYNHRVRRVDAGGQISTVAGTGSFGYAGDGGPAVSARLAYPHGVAVDAAGNLFIADNNNHRVRRVDAGGQISTVAGTGTAGYAGDGGPAVSARLQNPVGVAVDAAGNLSIADTGNHRVRRVDAGGQIQTVAGTGTGGSEGDGGPATSAMLNSPTGVAVDAAGNLFIADYNNNRVRRVDASGQISTVAGTGTQGYSGDGGPATSAMLNRPGGVAVDAAGGMLIADTSNHRVRRAEDVTAPSVGCDAAPPGWSAGDVTVACVASDGESGLADPADASFVLATSVPGGTETATAQTDTNEVCDVAGNCATAGPLGPIGIDKKAPSATITTPPHDAAYTLGASVSAAYGCADAGSGVGTCVGSVADGAPVDTSTPGSYAFTVATTDTAGNASAASNDYTVLRAASATSVVSSANPSVFGEEVVFTATVAGGAGVPTGAVMFTVDGIPGAPVALDGAGEATVSTSGLGVGSHVVTASYGGDGNHMSSGGVLAGGQAVAAAASVTTVVSSANPSVFGEEVVFTATVAGGAGVPTGAVMFTVDGIPGAPVALDGAGEATVSTSGLGVGSHVVTASYGGDGNHMSSGGVLAGGQTVAAAASVTTVTSSANPSVFGEEVVFTATVSSSPGAGTPTGEVTFSVDGTPGAPVTLDGAGQASLHTSTPAVGTHTVSAAYGGDGSVMASAGSLAGDQVVAKAATSTALTLLGSPSAYGADAAFRAVVAVSAPGSGTPSGTVTFTVDGVPGTPVALVGGEAEATVPSLTPGEHAVSAAYAGDGNLDGSASATETQLVQAPTTTTVTSGGNPSVYSEDVTFTAAVWAPPGAGTPPGPVVFLVDGVPVASVARDADGQATMHTAALAAGTYAVSASYAGATGYGASSGSLAGGQTVTRAATATTLASSANPSIVGQEIVFTAAVTPVPPASGAAAGAVVFSVDGVPAGLPVPLDGDGEAAHATSVLPAGPHTVDAAFTPADANHHGSVAPQLTQTVETAGSATAVTSSVNPSVFGQEVVFTATVTGGAATPTGAVVFTVDGVPGAPVALDGAGGATFATSALGAGSHPVSVAYSGDAGHAPSGAALAGDQDVDAAATTTLLASSLNPSVVGEEVAFTASVAAVAPGAGVPTGAVAFSLDGVPTGTPAPLDAAGVAVWATSALAAGPHTVDAEYVPGGADYEASAAAQLSQAVAVEASATVVTSGPNPSVFGQEVVFTATVSGGVGTPGGVVTFVVDGVAGAPVALDGAGVASFATSALGVGSHPVSVAYGGDVGHAPSGAALAGDQDVDAAATTTLLASSVNPSVVGESVAFTASVAAVAPAAGVPTGAVVFSVDGVPAGLPVALDGAGEASSATAALAAGSHSVQAEFTPADANHSGSAAVPLSQSVQRATSATALAASPNPSVSGDEVTFTATVTGGASAPTGAVVFKKGATTLAGPVPLDGDGVAAFATSGLAVGSHTITALYSGDAAHEASSAGVVQAVDNVVSPSATAVASDANPSTFGEGVTFTATVTGGPGTPTGAVTFVVDGVPGSPAPVAGVGRATFSTNTLAVGSHTVLAEYGGDAAHAPSVSAVLTQSVNPAATENGPAPAEVSVTLSGAFTSSNAGTLPAGQVTVTMDRDRAVRTVAGSGTVGDATVVFDVRRVLWFRTYSGAVSVVDPAAGVSLRVPVLFTPVTRLDPRGASGVQQWFVFRNWRIVPYTLTWSVTHPAATVPDSEPPQVTVTGDGALVAHEVPHAGVPAGRRIRVAKAPGAEIHDDVTPDDNIFVLVCVEASAPGHCESTSPPTVEYRVGELADTVDVAAGWEASGETVVVYRFRDEAGNATAAFTARVAHDLAGPEVDDGAVIVEQVPGEAVTVQVSVDATKVRDASTATEGVAVVCELADEDDEVVAVTEDTLDDYPQTATPPAGTTEVTARCVLGDTYGNVTAPPAPPPTPLDATVPTLPAGVADVTQVAGENGEGRLRANVDWSGVAADVESVLFTVAPRDGGPAVETVLSPGTPAVEFPSPGPWGESAYVVSQVRARNRFRSESPAQAAEEYVYKAVPEPADLLRYDQAPAAPDGAKVVEVSIDENAPLSAEDEARLGRLSAAITFRSATNPDEAYGLALFFLTRYGVQPVMLPDWLDAVVLGVDMRVVDDFGNSDMGSEEIAFDGKGPVAEDEAITVDQVAGAGGTPTLEVSVDPTKLSDTSTPVEDLVVTCTLRGPSGEVVGTTAAPVSAYPETVTLPGIGGGLTATCRVADRFRNQTDLGLLSMSLDTTPPAADPEEPVVLALESDDGTTETTTVTLVPGATIADDTAPPAAVKARLNKRQADGAETGCEMTVLQLMEGPQNCEYPSGQGTYTLALVDGYGNTSNAVTVTPAWAAPPPTPALWATGASVGSSVSPRFYVLQATFALYPAGTTARVYHEEGCGGAVRETLSVPTDLTAVAVAVPPGATTTLSVRVVNGEGGASACSASSVYTHVVVEDTPRILFTSPESGAGDDAGSVKAYVFVPRYDSATTVSLYKSGDCSGAVAASGTHSASGYASAVSFAPGGVSRVTLSARVSGPSAGTSACSAPFEYVNDVGKPVVSNVTTTVSGTDTVRWTWQMSDDVSSVGALRPRIVIGSYDGRWEVLGGWNPARRWHDLPAGTTEWTAPDVGLVGAVVTVGAVDEAGNWADGAVSSASGATYGPWGDVTLASEHLMSWDFGGGNVLLGIVPGATVAGTPPQGLSHSFCVSATLADLGCRPGVDLQVGDSRDADLARCTAISNAGAGLVGNTAAWRDVAGLTGLGVVNWPSTVALRTGVSGTPVYVRMVTYGGGLCRVSGVFSVTSSAAPVPRYPRLIVGSDWDHPSVVGSSLTPYVTPQDNFYVDHFTSPLGGTAQVTPGRVDVYATPDCTGPVVGTGAGRGGANVPVLPGSTTTFSARAVGAAGGVSACSNVVTYTHDNAPPTVGGPDLEPLLSTDVDTGELYMGYLGSWTLTDPNSTLAEMGEQYGWSLCTAAQVATGCGYWEQVPPSSRISAGYPTGGETRMRTHSLASRENVRLVDGVLVPASGGGPYDPVYASVCVHVGMAGDKYHNQTTTPKRTCMFAGT